MAEREEQEILVPASDILPGDRVIVHMGNVIPFDGEVSCGEGMVNQASLTGESLPVRRTEGQSVYAGTVLEEGELEIIVKAVSGATRFEKIVTMIEDSEKLKSIWKARQSIWQIVWYIYTLLGTGLVWAVTRNMTKALSVLMVDFFLRIEAGYADFCPFCNTGSRTEWNYRKGWEVSGGCGRGRYHRI